MSSAMADSSGMIREDCLGGENASLMRTREASCVGFVGVERWLCWKRVLGACGMGSFFAATASKRHQDFEPSTGARAVWLAALGGCGLTRCAWGCVAVPRAHSHHLGITE